MEEPITHLLLGVFGLPLAVGILLVIFVGIPAWREFWSKRKIKLDGDFDLTIDIPKSSFAEVIRSPESRRIESALHRLGESFGAAGVSAAQFSESMIELGRLGSNSMPVDLFHFTYRGKPIDVEEDISMRSMVFRCSDCNKAVAFMDKDEWEARGQKATESILVMLKNHECSVIKEDEVKPKERPKHRLIRFRERS